MSTTHRLPTGAHVKFDIEGLVIGTAIIVEADQCGDWTYRLDVIELTTGDAALLGDLAVEGDGGVWVCEHEISPLRVEVLR